MNKIILNLTMYQATKEQIKDGVIDLPKELLKELKETLLFKSLPNKKEIKKRVDAIYIIVAKFVGVETPIIGESYDKEIAKHNLGFLIGGAGYLMPALVEELKNVGTPLFDFTERKSIEKIIKGKVIKTQTFKHIGFVEV